MDFNILPFYYEATGGERYRKGGVPDSSIFTEEAIEYIREFETAVLNFESFQRLCYQSPFDGVNQNPCEGYFMTPIALAYATENVMSSYGMDCCSCNSTESCIASPLCSSINASHVSVHVPDGNAAASSLDSGIMEQLHDALDCENPAIPGAQKALGELVDRYFVPTMKSRTTMSFVKAGSVVDLSNVDGADQWDTVVDAWTDDFYPEYKKFVFEDLIPLMDDFNKDGPVRSARTSFSQVHHSNHTYEHRYELRVSPNHIWNTKLLFWAWARA